MSLSLSDEEEQFDCLARTNVDNGGVVVFSSDFVCRGGIGGGRGTLTREREKEENQVDLPEEMFVIDIRNLRRNEFVS